MPQSRCQWAQHELEIAYHDNEWGVPLHDDQRHFEFLILEGAQAGLSWLTVLKKRENYRQAFANFDPEIVARFTEDDIERLRQNEGIIRNKLKINSAVRNARHFWIFKKSSESLMLTSGNSRVEKQSRTIGNHWKKFPPKQQKRKP